MYCLVIFCDSLFAPYLLFLSPSSSPVDPETGVDATEYDYVTDDPSSCATELPGKPPLDQLDIAYSFSLLLALE